MSLVRLENVSKSFAGDVVLSSVNFRIEEKEKVAIIGRNGTGKSTIFRIITGEIQPDSGIVDRQRKTRFATLAQLHNVDDTHTIFDIVLHSFQDLLDLEHQLTLLEDRMSNGDEQALEEYGPLQEQFSLRGGYDFRIRIKMVLQGLGFHPDEFDMAFKALSGGQRTRLMLALVLLQEADLLLLDEPENHLDLEAREWLEDYLTSCRSAVVIVSHDRQMVNAVAQKVWDLERGELKVYAGGYDSYVDQKALYLEQQQAAFERQQEFLRKEEVYINRFRYKATKARAVQSRLKRLEKIELVEAPASDTATARFNLGEVVRTGAVVMEADGLTMRYGNLTLYENVKFQIHRGERVGIIGPNGAGKTTLLKHISGKLEGAVAGEVRLGHKVALGFYEQNHESMNPAATVLTEVHAAKPEWKPEQIRSFLGRFLFTGDDVFKEVRALSGGERSRVAMAKLILGGYNLILLDEPTNHLDIASREALEASLSDFPGAIVMISHDRALIDRLVDKLIIVQQGRVEVHLGNYSHYKWKLGKDRQAEEQKRTEDVLKIRRQKEQVKEKEKSREEKKTQEKEQRKNQRKLEQLEADIEVMEQHINGYESRFAALDPSDYEGARILKEEYDEQKAALQKLYEEWEGLVGTG